MKQETSDSAEIAHATNKKSAHRRPCPGSTFRDTAQDTTYGTQASMVASAISRCVTPQKSRAG